MGSRTAAYAPIDLLGQRWAMIVEVPSREALELTETITSEIAAASGEKLR